MAEFEEFKKITSDAKAVGTSADELRESTSSISTDLTDLGEVLVKVKADLSTVEAAGGNTEMMGALNKIDENFQKYFDNVSNMNEHLSKFVDPNYKMNKDDAIRLKEMTELNKKLLGGINQMREDDQDYNDKLTAVENQYNYNIRKQTAFQEESESYQKKYNLSATEIWEKIEGNIGVLSTELMGDLKETFLLGIAGPYGVLLKDMLSPFWDKFKSSEMFQSAKAKLTGIFSKEDQTAVGTEDQVVEAIEDLAVPEIADMKKKKMREDKVYGTDEEKMPSSINDLVENIKSQYDLLETLPDDIAAAFAATVKASGMSPEDVSMMNDELVKSNGNLSEIVSLVEMQSAKVGIIQALLEEGWGIQKEVWDDEDDFREEVRVFFKKILDSDGFGDGKGAIGAGLGALGGILGGTALTGLTAALAALAPVLGVIGVTLGAVAGLDYLAGRNLQRWDPTGAMMADLDKEIVKSVGAVPGAAFAGMTKNIQQLVKSRILGKNLTDEAALSPVSANIIVFSISVIPLR